MLNKCCCCIPLRAGVFIISLLSLVREDCQFKHTSLTFAALHSIAHGVNMTVPFYVFIAISSVLVLFSIFGLVGAMAQKRGFVQAFRVMYWIYTILAFIATFAVYIALLVKRADVQSACVIEMMNDSSNSNSLPADASYADLCSRATTITLAIYFACAVSAYATRLKPSYQHHPLRDLEDFPQTSYKSAVY
ncbi:hypothetical protein BX666DRAFT_1869498 [Dichotomocladium elegans]|nr:hypothetical protein BX666DRAFT_1869498 [Dichotomocladium elegans]